MAKSATPGWKLNAEWAVGTDPYNWILYHRSGKQWKAKGFFPTPEMLLKSLLQELMLSEAPQPILEQHVKRCLEVAQAAAASFLDTLDSYPQSVLKAPPRIKRGAI